MANLEAELLKLHGDLALAERQRQNAEAERDKLADEIGTITNRQQSLLDEKRQLEARISELEDELEDEHTTHLELAKDMARKSMIAMEQVATDLDAVSQKLENQRLALERENKEMCNKLQERVGQKRAHTNATIAALEDKTTNLEEQLDQEAKERAALARANRKMDKRLKELQIQAEDERRSADQYKEQLEKMNNRVNTLKRQVDEAEEEVARINAQKRKVQRDLDDQMEQNDVLVRESQSLRKYRPSAQARMRAPVKLGDEDGSEDGQEEQ